jgi:hypothetical protein
MHKNATKCNKTQSKWCINKHGTSKIIDAFETYHMASLDEVPETKIVIEPKVTEKIVHEDWEKQLLIVDGFSGPGKKAATITPSWRLPRQRFS